MKGKYIIPVLIGTGVGAYIFTRQKKAPEPDLEKLMLQAGQDESFNRLINEIAATKDRRYLGVILIVVEIKVSGAEKFAINTFGAKGGEEGILKAAVKMANNVKSLLPSRCPGSPPIQGDLKVQMADSSNGYKFFIRGVAIFTHDTIGPLRESVRACIEKLVKEAEELKGRVIRVSATRLTVG